MNKLMIAASAALCAAVGFSDVTSANIVGFQNKGTTANYGVYSMDFIPVGKAADEVVLGDFKIVQEDGDPIDFQGNTLWTLTVGGACKDGYYYCDKDEAEFDEVEVGWYDHKAVDAGEDTSDWVFANNVPMKYGQGFVLDQQQDGVKLVFSGEVKKGEWDTTLAQNYNTVGNATPVDRSIQDLALIQNDGDPIDFQGNTLWTLTVGGACKDGFYYADADEADFDEIDVGWYNNTEVDAGYDTTEWVKSTQQFPAGSGFVIDQQQDGVKLRLPAAIEEDK